MHAGDAAGVKDKCLVDSTFVLAVVYDISMKSDFIRLNIDYIFFDLPSKYGGPYPPGQYGVPGGYQTPTTPTGQV